MNLAEVAKAFLDATLMANAVVDSAALGRIQQYAVQVIAHVLIDLQIAQGFRACLQSIECCTPHCF